MKPYVIALSVGLLVGAIYGLLDVRSPAPPVIALVGLLGMLVGEQIPPLAKRLVSGAAIRTGAAHSGSWNHIFGRLPDRHGTRGQGEKAQTRDVV